MTTTNRPTTTNLRNAGGNWVIGTVEGLQVQAKVFEETSHYGMPENGRISILWVELPGGKNGATLYSYDRGDLMKNHLKDEAIAMICAAVTRGI